MAAASAAPLAAINGAVKMNTTSQAYLEGTKVRETKALISELCRQFYHLGWVSGTGGSITIKVHDDSIPKPQQLIVMSPSGVQKEKMMDEDMYVLSPSGSLLFEPLAKPWPNKPPKCSDCGPLFLKAYEMCNAGAVIHSHGMESCIVTMINPSSKEFRITHMEMIKGIQGHGYYDELVVPIIENTAHERELTQSLAEAIKAYPKTTAVLVRNHGVYIWGDSWINAKTQAECYHYLFEAAIKLHQLGLDWSTPSHGLIHRNAKVSAQAGTLNNAIEPPRRCIVLDIEGTTTPISFVTDVLFPYARDSVGKHLELTYDTSETQEDIKLIRAQVQEDIKYNVVGAVPIPSDGDKEEIIAAVVANVEAMIKADRKITSLKQLQGHIWRTGFQSKEIESVVFDDVPEALEKWHDLGIKVYIYSSGSRLAQRLLFGNTNFGDLRKYLCGYFAQTPITLWKILSQTWRVIAAHPRHFSTLSALLLLPISISAALYYPFVVSQMPPPSLSTPPKPQLLIPLIYTLSTLLFSLCAGSSITYSTFVAYHDKPVELIPSLQSILASFFPLLATRFLTLVIFQLITFAFVVLAMLAGTVAYTGLVMFGLVMDYDTRYYLILVIVFTAIMMMGLIYLQIKWCLSTAVVVLESKWGYAPLKRSSFLVQGTKKAALGLLLSFGSIGWGLSMWYFNVMAGWSRGAGGVSKGWFCVETVVYVSFATVLSLYAMVANTVLFINCKASREEMAVVVIDEEYVALLKA